MGEIIKFAKDYPRFSSCVAAYIFALILNAFGVIGVSWWFITLPIWIVPALILSVVALVIAYVMFAVAWFLGMLVIGFLIGLISENNR